MARHTRTRQRPPLRHLDLDALSEDELEALLFDGDLPTRRSTSRSRFPGGVWMAAGGIALLLLTMSEGHLLAPVLIALCGLYIAQRLAYSGESPAPAAPSLGTDRLTRSTFDKKIMGVCGGLARRFDIDPTIVRIAFLVALVPTGGAPAVLAYLLLAWVLPRDTALTTEQRLRIIRES